MSRHRPNYLKTHRKRLGLTQRELALLLGCRTEAKISRYERLLRKPSLETALACQVVFGVPPHEIFPEIVIPIEQAVIERAHLLVREIQAREETPLNDYKIRILRAVIDRSMGAR